MSIIDGFKKLAQPYDDDDDFFDEADESFKAPSLASDAQRRFENTFSSSAAAEPEPEDDEEEDEEVEAAEGASLFGSFKRPKAKSGRMSSSGPDQQVFLFSPKSIDECGALASYILNSRSVVMTLEGIPAETGRRMLDFMSGIAFALQGKITPISSKTYFVTPQNVDVGIVGSGAPSGGQDTF